MTDLRPTIVSRSDQLNADDLISGPRTITVTGVKLTTSADQPIAIGYQGDDGRVFKPCKSMRRIMVLIWGPDGASYVGRRMTLFRDERVKFGGQAVGGIRISHMSGLESERTVALTETKAQRKPFTVRPLADEEPRREVSQNSPQRTDEEKRELVRRAARAKAALGSYALDQWRALLKPGQRDALADVVDELEAIAVDADRAAESEDVPA